MDRESKIKLTRQVLLVSGAFCLLVAFLLVFNFLQMKRNEPLESTTIEVLVKRLAEDPRNEELKEEIRNFDLLARKAYFTSAWQVRTGAYLLLFGGLVFAIALKISADLRKKIEEPIGDEADAVTTGIISHRWLLITGVLVFVLALTSAFLSHNYLENYHPVQLSQAGPGTPDEGIEVITIVGNQDTSSVEVDSSTLASGTEVIEEKPVEMETSAPIATEKKFTAEDFKKNQSTFRAYLGQGISYHKNIPVDWDGASGRNIRWKVTLSKHGYNTPVIWGNKIFVAGGDASSRIVSCFNRDNGQLIWERTVDNIAGSPAEPPKVTEDTGLSAPTMTIDGTRIFAIFATGDIIAFDLEGNRIWDKNLGVPSNHYGHSSSLITWNGKLVVQYDTSKGGRMLALDNRNGNVIWDIKRDNMISWSSPMLMEKDGKMQIVTSADPNVSGYDLETGQVLWKVEAMMGEVAPSPAYYNGMVYASNEYARTVGIKAGPDPVIVWEKDDYLSEVSSPVAYKGLLFLATSYGVLVCYDALTGENYWEKEFNRGFYSSPMVADDKLYIIDMSGVMHIMKTDKTGTVISEPALGEAAYALPAFADGRIYLRSESSLYCIEN